jgi:DNA mismatch endonuclease (patch repair protein)
VRYDSELERVVRDRLLASGFDPRRVRRDEVWGADFVLDVARTAIFLHGCYWHRHSRCCSGQMHPRTNTLDWAARFSRTVQRDEANRKALRDAGWNVVVLWECRVQSSPDCVGRAVAAAIRKRHGRSLIGSLAVG